MGETLVSTLFSFSGWNEIKPEKETVQYLDSRCGIKLNNINMDNAELTLMTLEKEITAQIIFKISEGKIKVTSNSSCTSNCNLEISPDFDQTVNKKRRMCQIELKSGFESTISCNDSSTINNLKFGEVFGLKDAISTVRYVTFKEIDLYDLWCPGKLYC